ncbi:MAG: HlyD family efflux transporter periplasmic adaptor subunit [Planctomycetaceae bacterium]|nr:HlyD family efflux transporter periplasmic adaptor subunit [Planctomycetaceae bacterium]
MQGLPDISTVELSRTKLRLRDDLRFLPQCYGGETWYHLEVSTTTEFYRVGFAEYTFLSLLDGRTSFAEALAVSAQKLGSSALNQRQAMSLYSWLLEHGLASLVDEETASSGASTAARRQSSASTIFTKLNPFWIKIPFGRPEAFLKTLQPLVGWLFSPASMLCSLILFSIAGVLLRSHWSLFHSASATVISRDNWFWLLLAWISLKFIHETAHGLVCQRYGGAVRDTGVIFAFFTPMAYVDASSSWAFTSRWQRIHVAIAGMFSELVIASVCMILWTQTDSAELQFWLQNVILMASLSTLLFNLNPLMKFDGYFICSDLLQIPNLASQSMEVLQSVVRKILLGEQNSRPQAVGHRWWVLLSYGVASALWKLMVSLSMLIAASVLFHGAGLLLAGLGIFLWFARPLFRILKQCGELWRQRPERLFRGSLIGGAFVSLVVLAVTCLPAPVMMSAPGVVDFTDGETVRAETAGFIEQILVENGQSVSKGDRLLTLRNDDVTARHLDLVHRIAQEELRRQTASNEHDSGALSIADGNLVSLHRQLLESQRELEGLDLRASRDGIVVGTRLKELVGTFAPAGKDLMSIGLPNDKELQLSIGQRELPEALQHVGQPVRVRIGTRGSITGVLKRVNPRASRSIPHEALAAINGGELPVVQDEARKRGESSLRLTEHRFTAVVQIPAEEAPNLFCGERGTASLGLPSMSLGRWAWRSGSDWMENQLTAATQP